MKISKNRRLKDLQNEFSSFFPFLRIEFYRNPHLEGMSSDKNEVLDPELKVGEVCDLYTFGFMPLNGYQKVGNFEQLFAKTFGLNVQVFRKSYGKWLQTWATDIWTLEEQNDRGRIMGNKTA